MTFKFTQITTLESDQILRTASQSVDQVGLNGKEKNDGPIQNTHPL